MAMNRIQFQPGLSLAGFLQQYGTEAACARALRRARWPKGFVCPRCGGRRYGQDSGAPLAGGRSPLQSLARAAFARHARHRRRLNFSANQEPRCNSSNAHKKRHEHSPKIRNANT